MLDKKLPGTHDAALKFIDDTARTTPHGTPGGINQLPFLCWPAVAAMMDDYAERAVRAERQRLLSRLGDIARRVGPAATPQWVKDELEKVIAELARWSKPVG
jgi:hypothetical protein